MVCPETALSLYRNHFDCSLIRTIGFAEQSQMIQICGKLVMHTDVETDVIGNVMTQQEPVCFRLLNGSSVTVFRSVQLNP